MRARAAASARRGWSHPPKMTAGPCKCESPWTPETDSYATYPHFAEVEVRVDELRTIECLKALPCAPGSRLEVLDNGTRVKAQWHATAVGQLIEEGAQLKVLRDFILSEKPVRSTRPITKGITAAQTCTGEFRQGTNDTDYATVYDDWMWSDVYISGAPSNAVVTCVDVHYEIVYPYAGDLSITCTDEDLTVEYTLFDDQNDPTPNPGATVTGITDFAGEGVNQYWTLWVYDWYFEDDGYIDTWWIKVYYTVPTQSPANDLCANAVTLQDGVAYQGSTVGATGDYETWCSFYDMLDTWHRFTATRTGMVTISAESAEFDATLGVFDTCGGTELMCSDDRCSDDPDPQITMRMTAGVSYYIRVAGYDYRTGDYSLTVTQAPADLPDAPTVPSPSNAATGVATNPVLSWNDSAALASMAKARFASPKADRDAQPVPKVIYGADNRTEQYAVTNPNYLAAGDATVILVYWSDLTNNGNGTYTLPSQTYAYWYEQLDPLGTGNPLCADEPFRNQPAPGVCSGVLVTPDLIATAGHCVGCTTVSDLAAVFGYVMQDASTAKLTISAADVYRCSEIVAYNDGYPDWSLVRLDRPVAGHTPLSLQRTGQVTNGQELLVVGHPWGVPRKYDTGGTVRDTSASAFFQANVDTYIGSSGSPVIDRSTMEVLGIVTAGMESFRVDDSLTCDRSRVCPDTGCPGWEDVSRAITFSAMVPSFDVYFGTNSGSLPLVSSYSVVPWYRPGALQANTTYYWRIVARNAWGTTQGPLWSFTTGSTPNYSPVYRFWSPVYGRHFYTISETDRDYVLATWPDIWTYEGPVFNAFKEGSQPAGTAPVYRFWSESLRGHFYTISETDRDYVLATWPDVWAYEGPVFYAYPEGSQPAGTKPVYRFWSATLGGHFYTISETDRDYVLATWPDIWTYETIAWYAYE
ncbi:MAG: trypsin-like peptidase domain-containing protein [Sedimentisphaerales bacterium]|nr:trypsin-like peptidase domain-containing protein [Sedimentisphaerales bacterium]